MAWVKTWTRELKLLITGSFDSPVMCPGCQSLRERLDKVRHDRNVYFEAFLNVQRHLTCLSPVPFVANCPNEVEGIDCGAECPQCPAVQQAWCGKYTQQARIEQHLEAGGGI